MSVDNPAFAEDDCLLESFERRVVLRDDENRDLATRMTRRPVGEEPVDGGEYVSMAVRGDSLYLSPQPACKTHFSATTRPCWLRVVDGW